MSKLRTAADLVAAQRYRELRATLERGTFPFVLFRRNRLLIERLPLQGSEDSSLPPDGLRVEWAGPADMDALCRVRPRPEAFDRSFSDGHLCAIGWLEEEPVTLEWIHCTRRHVSAANGYSLKLPPGSAWLLGSYVRPDMRGRRLYRRHTRALAPLLRERGLRQGYCAVEVDNPASRKAHLAAGYEELLQFHVLRVLGVTRHTVRDLRVEGAPARSGWGPWSMSIED
mgnify:FL=1